MHTLAPAAGYHGHSVSHSVERMLAVTLVLMFEALHRSIPVHDVEDMVSAHLDHLQPSRCSLAESLLFHSCCMKPGACLHLPSCVLQLGWITIVHSSPLAVRNLLTVCCCFARCARRPPGETSDIDQACDNVVAHAFSVLFIALSAQTMTGIKTFSQRQHPLV